MAVPTTAGGAATVDVDGDHTNHAMPAVMATSTSAQVNGTERRGAGARMMRTPSPSTVDGAACGWPGESLTQKTGDQGLGGL